MYRNQHRKPASGYQPGRPHPPAALGLFCDRCGHFFFTTRLQLECPPCLYAQYPYRAVMGATRTGITA